MFMIEKIDGVVLVFLMKVFVCYILECFDDFVWENDKVVYCMYGFVFGVLVLVGVVKEVFVMSGFDIWLKCVDYLIVDCWYNKGYDYYYKD